MSKIFFIDTTRCTACRGCQVACKEWQEFEANKTTQLGWGSHQNPPDLNPKNYKIVRFNEHKEKGRVVWNFFPDQCRHCIEPPCKDAADGFDKNAVVVDTETGAVIYTDATKKLSEEAFEEMCNYCSYGIPRRDESTGAVVKCDMCNERVRAGLLPICVKTCPTGTMNFGDSDKMLELARKRLAEVKKNYPKARLLGEDSVRVIYLINDDPDNYHKNIAGRETDRPARKLAVSRKSAIQDFFRDIIS